MDDPLLQQWLKTMPFEVCCKPNPETRYHHLQQVVPIKTAAGMTCPAVQVTYQNQPLLQRPEQLLAALLNDAKQLAEQGAASPIQLLVLACPVHFTDAQRQVLSVLHTLVARTP